MVSRVLLTGANGFVEAHILNQLLEKGYSVRAVESKDKLISTATRGTAEMVKAIKANALEVKRLLLTSSFAAVVDLTLSLDSGKVYTESDWNRETRDERRETREQAIAGAEIPLAYRVSKLLAEKLCWDFVEQEKPNFDLVTINPPMIYGPTMHYISSVKNLNESTGRIYNAFINARSTDAMPLNGMHANADIREVAYAHLQAAVVPAASNMRCII